nr:outer membrane protein assembly factor BamE [Pararhizobium mangrovi]
MATALAAGVAGCASRTYTSGYVVDQDALKLVPVGSSREQVLLTLGSPSTKATFGNEVFYYITQKRSQPFAFMKSHVVSQSVLAVYFDSDGTVTRIANYTLKDGHVFDMISRTSPTGGSEQTFLGQLLSGGSTKPTLPGAQQQTPGAI